MRADSATFIAIQFGAFNHTRPVWTRALRICDKKNISILLFDSRHVASPEGPSPDGPGMLRQNKLNRDKQNISFSHLHSEPAPPEGPSPDGPGMFHRDKLNRDKTSATPILSTHPNHSVSPP